MKSVIVSEESGAKVIITGRIDQFDHFISSRNVESITYPIESNIPRKVIVSKEGLHLADNSELLLIGESHLIRF